MQQLGLLTGLATLIKAFTPINDEATNGMAIDLVPEEEHDRSNGLMTFGKAIGQASTTAVSGVFFCLVRLNAAALPPLPPLHRKRLLPCRYYGFRGAISFHQH